MGKNVGRLFNVHNNQILPVDGVLMWDFVFLLYRDKHLRT